MTRLIDDAVVYARFVAFMAAAAWAGARLAVALMIADRRARRTERTS